MLQKTNPINTLTSIILLNLNIGPTISKSKSIPNILSLGELLKYNGFDVHSTLHALNSIYLFADLEIKFISGTKKQNMSFGNNRFVFENNYYTIEFDYCKLYPNGYAPKYEIKIISKLSGNIINWQEFSSPLKMCVNTIYESVITFILSYCNFYLNNVETNKITS